MGLKPTPIDETNVGEQTLDPNDDSSNTFLNQLKDKRYAPGGEKSIYIKCEGEYPADKEALHGKMKMHPAVDGIDNTAKIPLKYFPYDKKREYNENPLVAIEFPGLFDKKSQEKAKKKRKGQQRTPKHRRAKQRNAKQRTARQST